MENKEFKIKQKLQNLASKMIDQDVDEWPPECFFFAYQPVRPELKPNDIAKEKSE